MKNLEYIIKHFILSCQEQKDEGTQYAKGKHDGLQIALAILGAENRAYLAYEQYQFENEHRPNGVLADRLEKIARVFATRELRSGYHFNAYDEHANKLNDIGSYSSFETALETALDCEEILRDGTGSKGPIAMIEIVGRAGTVAIRKVFGGKFEGLESK